MVFNTLLSLRELPASLEVNDELDWPAPPQRMTGLPVLLAAEVTLITDDLDGKGTDLTSFMNPMAYVREAAKTRPEGAVPDLEKVAWNEREAWGSLSLDNPSVLEAPDR